MRAPSSAWDDAVAALTTIGRRFYDRGWVMGTSGNLSAVVDRDPLRLAITPSAAHKGRLQPDEFLEIDAAGAPVRDPAARPSAETALHIAIAQVRGAGAVLHTHSVWSTILSGRHARAGGFALEGYEMLKGLERVRTHAHREWIPILANDQDMPRLADVVRGALERQPDAHAILLERHGLYTWGTDIAAAERHVEILEFLFEAAWRSATADVR